MAATGTHPSLRLVGQSAAPARPAVARSSRATTEIPRERAEQVASENRTAALSAGDARWVLAMRVAHELGAPQTGPRTSTTVLPGTLAPARREKLIRLGTQMGLRTFDSNLVIAIVQDAARRGDPYLREAADRLTMVSPPVPRKSSSVPVLMLASFALGALWLWIMLRWFAG